MLHLSLLAAAEGGFNPLDPAGLGNLLWTLIIFCVAAPFMWKVVMGPVTSALAERDSTAARAIDAAEKASADAEKVRAEVEVRLGEAEAEAAKLLGQARDRAETREREIVEAAKQEASSLVETARKNIRAEQDKAIAAIRAEVVDLSMGAASKVLERQVNGDDDRRLAEQLIAGQEASR